MFENNLSENSSCSYTEQIIEFLYGEADVRETTNFEAHLRTCLNCADEYHALRGVHSSMVEWRNLEFSSLELPTIEIPYRRAEVSIRAEKNSFATGFSFARFRRFFAPLPAAVFAVVLFGLGVIFLVVKFSDSRDVAVSELKNASVLMPAATNKETAATDVNKTEVKSHVLISSAASPKSDTGNVADEHPNIKLAARAERTSRTIKISEMAGKTAKMPNGETLLRRGKNAGVDNDQARYTPARKLPKLNELAEDDEDKSLRLAELFDADGK